MTFDAAAVRALFAAVVSGAQQLGIFENVIQHEPKNAPGTGLSCAVWVQRIRPSGRASGLAAVSGVVSMRARIYSNMLAEPQDGIDPDLLTAACRLIEAYSEGFTLGGTVRNVDIFGAEGEPLAAEAGYIQHDSRLFRVMEITLAIVINDLWAEAP
jgi:hypothetical protein